MRIAIFVPSTICSVCTCRLPGAQRFPKLCLDCAESIYALGFAF